MVCLNGWGCRCSVVLFVLRLKREGLYVYGAVLEFWKLEFKISDIVLSSSMTIERRSLHSGLNLSMVDACKVHSVRFLRSFSMKMADQRVTIWLKYPTWARTLKDFFNVIILLVKRVV